MPVSPRRQRAYPGGSLRSPEWLAIRERTLARFGHRCARCGVQNHATIQRGQGVDTGTFMTFEGLCFDEETGASAGIAMESDYDGKGWLRIVLTIAHIDHDPGNSDDANLLPLCQLHHNRLDARMRADRRRQRRNLDLFLDQVPA